MALRFWQQATRLKQSSNMIMLAVLTIWRPGPKNITKLHFQAIWAGVLRCFFFCPPSHALPLPLFSRESPFSVVLYIHIPQWRLWPWPTMGCHNLYRLIPFHKHLLRFHLILFFSGNQYYDSFIKWWNKQEYFGVIIKEKR